MITLVPVGRNLAVQKSRMETALLVSGKHSFAFERLLCCVAAKANTDALHLSCPSILLPITENTGQFVISTTPKCFPITTAGSKMDKQGRLSASRLPHEWHCIWLTGGPVLLGGWEWGWGSSAGIHNHDNEMTTTGQGAPYHSKNCSLPKMAASEPESKSRTCTRNLQLPRSVFLDTHPVFHVASFMRNTLTTPALKGQPQRLGVNLSDEVGKYKTKTEG